MRQKIEDSGTDHRWEFDRKRLFDHTNYMGKVCGDLYEVATVLDQFHKFLGPELKSVTGEGKDIDAVMADVDALPERLENAGYDIFDRRYKDGWTNAMQTFHSCVEDIEDKTKHFIERSFKKLRSAEGAFDLVENFKNIQSRESINQQIHERYNDILKQYLNELQDIDAIFQKNKENPPIYKNFPPTAGSIKWALDLYQRAKKPILRFKAHEGLLSSEYGEVVKNTYLTFARSVDSYKNLLYKEWEARVVFVATEKLKEPILDSPVLAAQRAQSLLIAEEVKEGEKKSTDKVSSSHLCSHRPLPCAFMRVPSFAHTRLCAGRAHPQGSRQEVIGRAHLQDAAATLHVQLLRRAAHDHPRVQVPRPHGFPRARGRSQRDPPGGQVPPLHHGP